MEHWWKVAAGFLLLLAVQSSGEEPPVTVDVQAVGPTWITLIISTPWGARRQPAHYQIRYRTQHDAMTERVVKARQNGETSVTLSELQPGAVYDITVSAVYADGSLGPASVRHHIRAEDSDGGGGAWGKGEEAMLGGGWGVTPGAVTYCLLALHLLVLWL